MVSTVAPAVRVAITVQTNGPIRVTLEAREAHTLAIAATRSANASRQRPEESCSIRTDFQRDRDRIIHAKSFRRLMYKTQVLIAPGDDHSRTRLTHTLEVTQIARTIGRALRLNEDLIEAIGLAHDLGHTPFGHAGEAALADLLPGFRHNEQSLRVVDLLEKGGRGLNLTDAVRDGILLHSKAPHDISQSFAAVPTSAEGDVLKISDGVAYINHDLDDAVQAGIIGGDEVPPGVFEVLGASHSARINTLVCDIIAHSSTEQLPATITMSPSVRAAANTLRNFLFERVYVPLNQRDETVRAQHVIRELAAYYLADPRRLPTEFQTIVRHDPPERRVADFIASMTDRFAVDLFQRLFVPNMWSV